MNSMGLSRNQNLQSPSHRPHFGALEVKLEVDPSKRAVETAVINTLKNHFPEGTQTSFRKNDSEVRITGNSDHFETVIEQSLTLAGFKSIKKVEDTPDEAQQKEIHRRTTNGLSILSEYTAEAYRLLGKLLNPN